MESEFHFLTFIQRYYSLRRALLPRGLRLESPWLTLEMRRVRWPFDSMRAARPVYFRGLVTKSALTSLQESSPPVLWCFCSSGAEERKKNPTPSTPIKNTKNPKSKQNPRGFHKNHQEMGGPKLILTSNPFLGQRSKALLVPVQGLLSVGLSSLFLIKGGSKTSMRHQTK